MKHTLESIASAAKKWTRTAFAAASIAAAAAMPAQGQQVATNTVVTDNVWNRATVTQEIGEGTLTLTRDWTLRDSTGTRLGSEDEVTSLAYTNGAIGAVLYAKPGDNQLFAEAYVNIPVGEIELFLDAGESINSTDARWTGAGLTYKRGETTLSTKRLTFQFVDEGESKQSTFTRFVAGNDTHYASLGIQQTPNGTDYVPFWSTEIGGTAHAGFGRFNEEGGSIVFFSGLAGVNQGVYQFGTLDGVAQAQQITPFHRNLPPPLTIAGDVTAYGNVSWDRNGVDGKLMLGKQLGELPVVGDTHLAVGMQKDGETYHPRANLNVRKTLLGADIVGEIETNADGSNPRAYITLSVPGGE